MPQSVSKDEKLLWNQGGVMCQCEDCQVGQESRLARGSISLLLYSDLQLIGRGPPTLGRAVCFTQY